MVDFFLEENELTKKLFDLDELISFQLTHDVQVIRGEDYMYLCYIDGEGYGASLTPLLALCLGVKQYKELKPTCNNCANLFHTLTGQELTIKDHETNAPT